MSIVIRDVDIEHLTEIETIQYICEKTGYEYVGELPKALHGAQAKPYFIRKDGTEYVLKYFTPLSAGGCGYGYRKGETFLIKEYLKQVEETNKRFRIERALASDEELKTHPNIARTIVADDITFTQGNVKLTEWFIIMKKYQPLSLDAGSIPNIREEKEVLRLGVQICNALITLHGRKDLFNEASKGGGLKGILHGDIKPGNILAEKTEKGTYNYVLADFGLSVTKGSNSSVSPVRGGTLFAMCPEYVDGYYSIKADLYALCATLYLLLNEGPLTEAAPRERVVKDDTGNGYLIGFTGRMPEPKNASQDMKELLVNALEYNSADRNCKSARELKDKLQEIQFKHAREAYDQGDMEECEAYISDLKEYKPRDKRLLELIREVELKLSLANLCDADRTGTVIADASLKQERQTLYRSETANFDKRAGEGEGIYKTPIGQQIAKLIFVSALILVTMGGNLIASLSAEFDYIHVLLSGGITAILAGIFAFLCRKLLRGSTYGSIAIDLILIGTFENYAYTCARIDALDMASIWSIIVWFICFVIATLMTIMIITICEDVWISPRFIVNYIPSVITTALGAFIYILGNIEVGISAFSEEVYVTGTLALAVGGTMLVMKLGFYKEIKIQSSANRKVKSLKRYDVVTFGDDTKVVVLEKCKYKGDKYVFVNEILPEESNLTEIYKIMIIHPEDNTLEAVWDPAILVPLGLIFEKKLNKYV